ncbi:MAG TPA: hypothetical protein VME41_04280 [Stellaceae bacterium]|nr:hypothetical protein [Stellaceae bacterium]
MDLNALREAAIEATERTLYDRLGFVPADDSDEWEEEYRRQFAALKQRPGATAGAPAAAAPRRADAIAAPERHWPEMTGTPEQKRWAASIRDDRMREIANEPFRRFLAYTWTRAKVWVDTRDVPTALLVQRLKPQFDDYRRRLADAAKAKAATAQQQAAAVAAHRRRLDEAGITAESLIELIDASERFGNPAALAAKLAEIDVEGRHLRVYETSDPNLLLVKEKKGPLQLPDYAIERDEGLVADLKLFAQAP